MVPETCYLYAIITCYKVVTANYNQQLLQSSLRSKVLEARAVAYAVDLDKNNNSPTLNTMLLSSFKHEEIMTVTKQVFFTSYSYELIPTDSNKQKNGPSSRIATTCVVNYWCRAYDATTPRKYDGSSPRPGRQNREQLVPSLRRHDAQEVQRIEPSAVTTSSSAVYTDIDVHPIHSSNQDAAAKEVLVPSIQRHDAQNARRIEPPVVTTSLRKLHIITEATLVHATNHRTPQQRTAQDQLELLTIENDADPAEPDENERFEYENRYYELCSKAEELIDKFTIKASSSSTNIKLPTIELPHFDGEYTSWTAFYDSFRTLIHENTNLEKIQKLHYLRSCLGDEPKRIIDNLSISAQSYDTAWRLLKERYHSKRLIVHNHIHGLFNLTQVNKSPNSLRTLLDQLNANLESLKAQNLDVTNWDPVLIYLVSTKFDFATKREWESKLKNNELPTLKEMTTFISQRCQTLESMEFCNSFEVNSENPRYNFTKSKFPEVKRKLTICPKCKQSSHCFVQQCTAFLQLSIQDRINEVKRLKLCLNCLREGHDARSCTSRYCRTCNGRHHTLLHLQKREPQSVNNHSCSTEFKSLTLLSTAVIKIRDGNGQLHKVRALLDIGSDSNFITDKLCRLLKLNLNKCQVSIAGIGQTSTTLTRAAKVFIKSLCDNYSNTISCLVLPEITNNLPVETFDPTPLRIPDNLTLADPEFYISGEIDLLIGAGLFYDILREGRIKLQNNITYVQNSCFGWLVGGPYTNVGLQCQGPRENSCLLSTNSLEHQMSKFWELEGMDNNVNFTTEHEACEISFVTTTKRDPDGRFLVALPVKTRPLDIGQSKRTAINQFKSLEGKFGRNHGLRDEYNKFLGEYLALNHMERVTVPDDPSIQCVYLPHHPVIKETSLTTKTRVVFNASSRTSNGQSLNDNLMTGPNLQADLFSIIVRCRLHKYVLSADLSKMFRQIWVRPEDRDLLRIAYRFDQTEPIQVFRLKTVTYGLNCAPFLAMRCLRELAYEASADYPQAAKTILNSFYMDDLLVGVDNVDEGIKLRDDLNNILKGGGFELYKWASNETKLLPNQDSENNTAVVRLDSNFETKALGLTWNCQRDLFKYQLAAIKLPKVATKRNVLSIIAKIFDPLGLLSPMLIVAKILLQKLWQLKLNWDEPIPSELSETFHHFCANLHRIDEFVIPRCINYFSPQILELHGFCDTSKEAYGAAIYVVAVGENKQRQINLLCSKSRVAPLKPTTIPRLELCAAVLLAKLTVKIINTLDICVGKIYLWSDSMITLSWIAAEPKRWEPFVAHRVAAIQEMTKREQWHYVNSQQNPADIITRAFLLKDSSHWPKPPSHVTELPPERRNVTLVSQTQPDLNVFHRPCISALFDHISPFLKINEEITFTVTSLNMEISILESKKLIRNWLPFQLIAP
ncbi:uncharacterized protein LOC135134000 [Zophobas morio]|uniref:uncharacterized protein LOC135134000 n=1 Tax=Zophobas morio TaxID=2755281 RepID=UPI003082C919